MRLRNKSTQHKLTVKGPNVRRQAMSGVNATALLVGVVGIQLRQTEGLADSYPYRGGETGLLGGGEVGNGTQGACTLPTVPGHACILRLIGLLMLMLQHSHTTGQGAEKPCITNGETLHRGLVGPSGGLSVATGGLCYGARLGSHPS
ncbi:hypothetical protein RF55_5913 [Lasius niger]|uniref:Uncharacterized protein n=1 Tax=Lasius niger TaxID=67767 RepID=A0A0J7KUG0_LASNI|nr:hypothetical protein RF55_5913 [Lasius niger]